MVVVRHVCRHLVLGHFAEREAMANERRSEPIMEDWVLGFITLDSREANGRSQAAKGELKCAKRRRRNQRMVSERSSTTLSTRSPKSGPRRGVRVSNHR